MRPGLQWRLLKLHGRLQFLPHHARQPADTSAQGTLRYRQHDWDQSKVPNHAKHSRSITLTLNLPIFSCGTCGGFGTDTLDPACAACPSECPNLPQSVSKYRVSTLRLRLQWRQTFASAAVFVWLLHSEGRT
jgi:hypothetical protein